MVHRYVESGTDHKRVVLSSDVRVKKGQRDDLWSTDIILDDADNAVTDSSCGYAAPVVPVSSCQDQRHVGSWAGSVISAITQSYGGGRIVGTGSVPCHPSPPIPITDMTSLLSLPNPGGRSVALGAASYYYPINPSALYDASRALLQLVWRGYRLPTSTDATSVGSKAVPTNLLEVETNSVSGAGQMADLLQIAQYVDELEDRNAIVSAERDQAKAIGRLVT